MKRRPVCLVCLILLLCMYILDLAGIPLVSGNPLPEKTREWIAEHPEAVICGEVQRCQETENSFSVYLSQVLLTSGSEHIPIKNIKVFLKKQEKLLAGMTVQISGKLEETEPPGNPGEFDSRQFYACQKIYYLMKNGIVRKKSREYSAYRQALQDFKEKICSILQTAAPEDAGVFEAMLIGEKKELDQDLKLRYQMAGMIHILAISGLHISMLGLGLFQMLKLAGGGNILAGMISLTVMLQYGMLTGGGASAMRAVGMFLVATGAKILGRSYDLLTALALSAILLILDSPAYLYSSSFLLSFGAVVGLGVTAPVLSTFFASERKLINALLASFAVQITTLPLVLTIYGEVSVAGLLLNLIVLPTVSIVLLSGLGCCAVGFFHMAAASAAAIPGHILLVLYEKTCRFVGKIPLCTWISGAPKLWQSVLYYILLVGILGIMWCGKKQKPVLRKCITGAGAMFGICGILVLGYHPQKNLSVTCLDIGQGDGIVLKLPGGGCYLMDCGSTSKKKTAQYQLLPYLKNQGISSLDGILISHTDADHISGVEELLEMLEKNLSTVKVRNLFLPEWKTRNDAWKKLQRIAEKNGIRVWKVSAGKYIKSNKSELRFLAPEKGASGEDVNEEGAVMEIRYGEFKGLLTGDIGEKTEKKLLPVLEDMDFLKVGHHGSRYSTCREFLEKIKPEVAFISCSQTNTYGHPSQETIERLEEAGAKVEYTMKSGALTVYTDGKKMWTEHYRE
ncbi:DNA internalization-related competence protein ComEC/Rec2 [Blautia sp. HCP28S3_G10]|uniref:DNA internalization-related competence protein ComEC/Rec2 n=1 Tax=Blautia sp. HCP28S3_G10 TaxID=3438908 RepID=UPI003F8AF2F4